MGQGQQRHWLAARRCAVVEGTLLVHTAPGGQRSNASRQHSGGPSLVRTSATSPAGAPQPGRGGATAGTPATSRAGRRGRARRPRSACPATERWPAAGQTAGTRCRQRDGWGVRAARVSAVHSLPGSGRGGIQAGAWPHRSAALHQLHQLHQPCHSGAPHLAVTEEQGAPRGQLRQHAAGAPRVDGGRVGSQPQQHLGRAVKQRLGGRAQAGRYAMRGHAWQRGWRHAANALIAALQFAQRGRPCSPTSQHDSRTNNQGAAPGPHVCRAGSGRAPPAQRCGPGQSRPA